MKLKRTGPGERFIFHFMTPNYAVRIPESYLFFFGYKKVDSSNLFSLLSRL